METKNVSTNKNTSTTMRRPSKKNLIKTNFMRNTDKAIAKAIQATLVATPFTKFSIPLYAYNRDLFDGEPEDSKKVTQIGFVKSYDKDKRIFHIMTYMSFKEKVRDAIKNPEILVDYVTYEEKFAKINRLIIVNSAQ